jgi:cobalamin biosynthesis Mg chelatase CobN
MRVIPTCSTASRQQGYQTGGRLPERFREAVLKEWGAPERPRLMTVVSRHGEPYFVVPGIRLGNLFLGPQPLRTTFVKSVEVMHFLAIPTSPLISGAGTSFAPTR